VKLYLNDVKVNRPEQLHSSIQQKNGALRANWTSRKDVCSSRTNQTDGQNGCPSTKKKHFKPSLPVSEKEGSQQDEGVEGEIHKSVSKRQQCEKATLLAKTCVRGLKKSQCVLDCNFKPSLGPSEALFA
jgi:hypothetical protein